ncbi:unnamed protein product [Rotaria sp. Silwood2]|nr:unnamed protein product [Rotaria sp. Silwood2]
MNIETYTRRTSCSICSRLSLNKENANQNLCETYLLRFLIELQEKLDNQNRINEHFSNSIFDDEDNINQTSCNGLTLMHVNVLGARGDSSVNESEEENNMFVPPYEESIALHICEILLKRGASPNGNAIYEMRPLHITIRRQWIQISRLLLEAAVQHIFKHQITDCILHSSNQFIRKTLSHDYAGNVYTHIWSFFQNLKHFTIIASSENDYSPLLIYELPSSTFNFSTITVLHIDMFNLHDCISLFDGCLKQSTTFIVRVHAVLLLIAS